MAGRFRDLNRPAQFLVLGICGLALYLLVASWKVHLGLLRPDLIVYLAMVTITGSRRINLPSRQGTVSVSSAVILAAVLRFPVPGSLLVAGVGGVAGSLLSKLSGKFQPLHRILFAASTLVISAWGASRALLWMGGEPGAKGTVATLSLAAVATMVYYLLDSWIVAAIVGLSQRKPPWGIWKEEFLWMIPGFYMGALCGLLMNLLFEKVGVVSVAIIGLPLYIIYRAYRRYVDKWEASTKPPGPRSPG
jgi:hypothetical protein